MQLVQHPSPNAVQLALHRVFRRRTVARVLRHSMHRIDTPLLRWSKGRWSLPPLVGGLPNTILLTTTGARSGRLRHAPLLAHHGDRGSMVVIGTNFGRAKHPAWYHNIRHYPVVEVTFGGATQRYHARDATDDERARYWARAAAEYSGYTWYARHTGPRKIPIVVLAPVLD